jgi:hypothetical protein
MYSCRHTHTHTHTIIYQAAPLQYSSTQNVQWTWMHCQDQYVNNLSRIKFGRVFGFRADYGLSLLFCDITRRMLVYGYRYFGTTCRVPFTRVKGSFALLSKMVPRSITETSVTSYQPTTTRSIPHEGRLQLLRGGSQKFLIGHGRCLNFLNLISSW